MYVGEIEDLEVADNRNLIIHFNNGSTNKVYHLNIDKLNYNEIKVYKNNSTLTKSSVTATVYNISNQKIGTYQLNANSSFEVRNLPTGRYKAVITSIQNSKNKALASSKGKTITFEIRSFNPYNTFRFDI